jgi:hypothetical protein
VLVISSWRTFWRAVIPKYLNFAMLSENLLDISMLWYDCAVRSGDETTTYTRTYFSPCLNLDQLPYQDQFELPVFYVWYLRCLPTDQPRPAADVSHLISVPAGFPGPSQSHILNRRWKIVPINIALFWTIFDRKHIRHMFTDTDITIGFIQTHFN